MTASNESNASVEECIAHHHRMAEAYHQAYLDQDVKDGSTYEDWVFADEAVYFSPYFGNNPIDLKTNPLSVQASAHMEALTYSVTLPDWKPLDFECWPSPDGFAMKSHFGGHKDGKLYDFYAYGFVKTNEAGEIIHWETHVSPEYNDFLDVVIGCHGPFKNGAEEYMEAVMKSLVAKGIDPRELMQR